MTSGERQRERAKTRRRSAALESDDEGGCGQWVGPESHRGKFFQMLVQNCRQNLTIF